MIRNVDFPDVDQIGIAVVSETTEINETEWYVYAVNTSKQKLTNVMITSRGYGVIDGKDVKTTTLRRFIGDMDAKSFLKIEPIKKEVFGLNNEYWVSFYDNEVLHDKKYLFTSGSINEEYLKSIPLIDLPGIWHP